MIQGFRGREDTHSRDDPGFRGREGGYTQQGRSRVLEGGKIHTAGMIPGFRGREGGREDTHSRDDPGF